MGDQDQGSIPSPPVGSSITRRAPFICPYCHQTVQVDKDEDWIYHVYSDLRPYICTSGGCVKEDQLYDSFTEWSAHERQFHRREWFCGLCQFQAHDESLLVSHLVDNHPEIPGEQRQEQANLTRSSTLPQQCPLCTKPPISSLSRFQQHLARHLQQLALFVLPRGEFDDAASAAREEESNESRQALMTDEQERESLFSISTHNKASAGVASRSDEQNPIDDRLLDAIPKELTDDASGGVRNKPENTPLVNSLENHQEALQKKEADALAALELIRIKFGPNHPETVACMDAIADIYRQQGRYGDLETFLTELLALKQSVLGPEHSSTIASMAMKGSALYRRLRYAEAE
jgi:transcription initiation factor TFIIIB Brf1 subunit/transcription initiation factor TFIIB